MKVKTKLFALIPLILATLYPIFVFEVTNTSLLGHDLYDYSMPIFFITIISAVVALCIVKGKMKLFPILALLCVLPTAYFGLMLSMS